MGLYWATFICNDRFIDRTHATVKDQLQIQSIDPVIESIEWREGFVRKDELAKLGLGTLVDIDCDEEENDVFMSETVGGTYDPHDKSPPQYKYILVARNCKFVPKTHAERAEEQRLRKVVEARAALEAAQKAVENARKVVEALEQEGEGKEEVKRVENAQKEEKTCNVDQLD